MLNRLDTIAQRDRRTDGRTEFLYQYRVHPSVRPPHAGITRMGYYVTTPAWYSTEQ